MTTTQSERKDTTENADELAKTIDELEAEVMAELYEEWGAPEDDENEE